MTSRDQLREQQSGLGTKQRPSRAAAQPLQLQNDATRSTKTCEQGRKAPTGAIDQIATISPTKKMDIGIVGLDGCQRAADATLPM